MDATLWLLTALIAFFAYLALWPSSVKRDPKIGGTDLPVPPHHLPFGLDLFWRFATWSDRGEVIKLWRWAAESTKSDTFMLQWLGETNVATFNPENIKHILAGNFENYEKGEWFRETWHEFLGTGIFNSDGPQWKNQRTLSRPYFTQDKITNLTIFDKHMKSVNEILDKYAKNDEVFDIQSLWFRFTIDSASDFLFGKNVDSLHDETSEFAKHFNYVQDIQSKRTRMGKIWPYLMIPSKAKLTKSMAYIHAYIEPLVVEALKRQEANPNAEPETLLDSLCQVTKDRTMLRDALLNILLAGRDTTASLLTWTIYNLSQKPDVVKRLREELDENIPIPAGSKADDFFPIDYSQLKACRFLRSVLNETLRLYPSVPGNIRTSIKGDVFPTGHYVPPKTNVFYTVHAMQRRSDLWGPDADEFNPDRWNLQDKPPAGVPPFGFLPFNGGPRICLGQQFAYNEASQVLARFLRTWDWELQVPVEDVKPTYSIIITVDDKLPVKITKRT